MSEPKKKMGILDKIRYKIWAARNKDKIAEFQAKAQQQAEELQHLMGPIISELNDRSQENYDVGVTQEQIERYYEKHQKVIAFRKRASTGWNTGGSMWATQDIDNVFPVIQEELFARNCRRQGWNYIKENCFLEAIVAENGMTFYIDVMTDGNGYDHMMYWTFDEVPEQEGSEEPEIHLEES